jgi:16S rRNA processing protein RimM
VGQDEVAVGRIAGVFGLLGELKCDPTSAGRIVFERGTQLECARDGTGVPIRLRSVRAHKGRLLIGIDGVEDADEAQSYVGCTLYAPHELVTLSEGEYLDEDLIGCVVCDKEGTPYGNVDGVEHYPSSDMMVISGRMVPMVRPIVKEIDLARRRIVIDPPAGLLD